MLNLKGEQLNLLFYPSSCLTSQGAYFPHIDATEANYLRSPCKNHGFDINIVNCKSRDLGKHLSEINGLDFTNVNARQKTVPLPNFIPVINGRFFDLNSNLVNYKTIGISLKDIVKSEFLYGRRVLIPKNDLLKMPLFKNKQIVLFMSGKDSLVERIWREDKISDFYLRLKELGFYLVTGIDFSIFFGECPLGHAINLKKSLASYSQLEDQQINSAPNVYWANKFQIERWVGWLNLNVSVDLITINCQCYKPADYSIIVSGIKYIIKKINRPLVFLLEGPKIGLLNQLASVSGSIKIAFKKPAVYSMNHQRLIIENGKVKSIAKDSAPKEQILNHNLETYDNFLKKYFYKESNSFNYNLCQSTSAIPASSGLLAKSGN